MTLYEDVPCDQLDKVIVEGDASAGIKDGGVAIAVEVCGDNLRGKKDCLINNINDSLKEQE